MCLFPYRAFSVVAALFFLSFCTSRADDTWTGASGTGFSTNSNWADNSAPVNDNAGDLTFGAATNYTVQLNQGKSNVQTVDVFLITGGASSYNFTRTGSFSYTLLGLSNTNGNSIVNTSGNRVTFNVPIEQSAQNGASFSENIWAAGTGGITFSQTVSFASNSKDVLVTGSVSVNMTAVSALSNSTGSSAIIYASTGSTVNISGTVGVTSANAGMHGVGVRGGTMLLSGPSGSDLIQDSDNNARGTRLELQGGLFGFTDADNVTGRIADFQRSLTVTATSTIQFGSTTGGGIIAFSDSNNATNNFNNQTIYMTNWNGTPNTGNGVDQFIFYKDTLFNGPTGNGDEVLAGDTLTNVQIQYNGQWYYALVIVSQNSSYGANYLELIPGALVPPVPEPSTYAMGGFLVLALGAYEVRRRRAKVA